MQTMDRLQVFSEIKAHIKKQEGAYSDWYAGITSDWENRLFSGHGVLGKEPWYIVRKCYDEEDAKIVARELQELGCDGNSSVGKEAMVYVYAYLKGDMTNP